MDEGLDEGLEGEGQAEIVGKKRKRKRGRWLMDEEMDKAMEEVRVGREESIEL